MEDWLCPPLGQSLELQGKFSSNIFKRLSLYIYYCDQGVDPNCIGDAALGSLETDLGSFSLRFFVVSTQVNPNSVENYTTYYIDDRNDIEFTSAFAAMGTLEIADYQI
jgi:hypothetical protein